MNGKNLEVIMYMKMGEVILSLYCLSMKSITESYRIIHLHLTLTDHNPKQFAFILHLSPFLFKMYALSSRT